MKAKAIKFKNTITNLLRKEINIFLICLMLVAGTWVFIELADQVTEGSTQKFDELVLKSLRGGENYEIPQGPEWFSEAMRDITALGGGVSIILITLFVAGFMFLRKQYSILWFLLFATIGGALLSIGLKELFGRERPTIVLHLMTVNSLSFPSGHSMMSMVVYLTQASLLARIEKSWKIRTYIISIALFLSFIIGISRIYLGVHYPTDVLAGWAMGLTWASICWIAVWYIQRKKAKRKKLKHTEEALDNNSEEYERSDS